MPEIKTGTDGAVRVLTISNEPKRNALAGTMAADLLRFLDDAEADPKIRAVVITGEGSVAFSSGHDLQEISSGSYAATGLGEAPFLRPLSMRKPVIAAVNGHCYAAALILVLSCDLRVASENAAFGSPGARLGMLPEGGQIGRLPHLMAHGQALELMLTAAPMSAAAAHAAGFVNRVVPPGRALEEALALAQVIAGNSPSVVAAIKAGVLLGERQGCDAATAYEERIARELEAEADAKEGVLAFFEKRQPVFQDLL